MSRIAVRLIAAIELNEAGGKENIRERFAAMSERELEWGCERFSAVENAGFGDRSEEAGDADWKFFSRSGHPYSGPDTSCVVAQGH